MLYEIPVLQRFTKIGKLNSRYACLHIDEVGLFVYHDNGQRIKHNFVRRHIILQRKTQCIIEGDSPEKAIQRFFSDWEGSKIGGESEESKALWINRAEPILELPNCSKLHRNQNEKFICGEEEGKTGQGVFGMCVLENYDYPTNCPLYSFHDQLYSLKTGGNLPVATLCTKGFEYSVVYQEALSLCAWQESKI